MTIAQSTTIQAYQLKRGGVHSRMAILRMIATDSVNNRNPSTRLAQDDWRKARRWKLNNYEAAYGALDQGFNGTDQYKTAIWYCSTGEQFRNDRYCDEVSQSISHTGWFCDIYQDRKARGIVANLTHGRYIAGYEISDSGERVYFDEIHTDEKDAAFMADEHARVIAEIEIDYSEQN